MDASCNPITHFNKRPKSRQSVTIGNYIYITPPIGKGSFSKVYLGHNKLKHTVAIKKIDSSNLKKMTSRRIEREIELLKSLKHPNIVEFLDTFTDTANNIYVVMEYCNYGSLDRFIGSKRHPTILLDETEIKSLFIQLRDGLKFLLAGNVLHRDIKPQNILLHKVDDVILLKIADFGFAKYFENLEEDEMTETLCGTSLYLAPEIIKEKKYTICSDLWSVGMILYQLFYHTTPFKDPKTILELIRNLDQMKLNFPFKPSVNCGELMTDLLKIDPNERITWGNFFEHTWFNYEDNKQDMLNSSNMSMIVNKSILAKTTEFFPKLTTMLDSSIETLTTNNDDVISNIKEKIITSKHEDHKEIFLNQSSKLYDVPKFMENYIPASISLPVEKTLLNNVNINHNNVFASSLSPRPPSPFVINPINNYNLQNHITVVRSKPINIPSRQSILSSLPGISNLSSLIGSDIQNSLSPYFTALGNTITNSISNLSKYISSPKE